MNKIKVLLVEDETSLAMILSDTLEAQGFEMRTAHDGEEGLRMFDEQKPDVLVADVMMPKMDGFEMVRRIRKTDSRTPVLFLTARSAVNDVVEGFELGGNDYLKKPFAIQELIVRI
ncbi:two-component system response regulator, partial [human gut metagenome]